MRRLVPRLADPLGSNLTGGGGGDPYPEWPTALDFTSAYYKVSNQRAASFTALPGASVTRASAKYGETTAGLLVPFASGVPAITNKGLLVEEARTNLVLMSANLASSAYWASTASTTTDLGSQSLGVFQNIQIASTGAFWNRQANANVSLTAGTTYTTTFYYKAGTSGQVYLTEYGGSTSFMWDVGGPVAGPLTHITATAGATVSSIGTPVQMADGVYRVSIIWTPTTSTPYAAGIGPNSAVVGQTVIGLGVRVEAGSFATSYIPTTTAAATRAADDAKLAVNLPAGDFILQTSFTTTRATSATRTLIDWSDGTDNNKVRLTMDATNHLVLAVINGGVSTPIATEGGSPAAARTATAEIRRASGNWSLYVNDALVATAAAAAPPVTSLQFGNARAISAAWNDYIRTLLIR